ncbi:hypothetical protein E2C01_013976 [Portunus trituberculatus]|uniref:Uncharacterized protein n=1 Tax=Portunus trituberculatus TaxID=210409 RepID=A0A5B7DHL3_PORTR|nr:hypothetical protein [Portunus trituberculatus]
MMDNSPVEVWRRLMLCIMTVIVMGQMFTDIMVAKGEFVHKNFTESVGDSGPSLGLRGEDTTHETEVLWKSCGFYLASVVVECLVSGCEYWCTGWRLGCDR